MEKAEDLPLYLKTYQLIKENYSVVKSFPKTHKYTLGEDIIKLSWKCLDLFLEANFSTKENKKEKISKLSIEFDKLKLRIRMAQELNLISIKKFSHLQNNYISEIGKMIGAWLKWAKGGNNKFPSSDFQQNNSDNFKTNVYF